MVGGGEDGNPLDSEPLEEENTDQNDGSANFGKARSFNYAKSCASKQLGNTDWDAQGSCISGSGFSPRNGAASMKRS